ncbi:MAG: UDP-N-acetylmuramoyl-L-alanyl-D-glutamate--2,6-diaminopimelate ligase [candidate division WS1 bacterium]|nr:UDP-N-acetylmuramoyl-L-alanyl-D-glutamate--2,6-diaminopimelate ligase [candidate division WS1 bacterium]
MTRIDELTRSWAGSRRLGQTPTVTAVVADSRQVTPGALFVAIPGFAMDGHQFIPEALQRGAVAIVYQNPQAGSSLPPEIAAIQVPDSRRALAELAADFHGHPSTSLTLVGITGTNGKTTSTWLLDAVARAAGKTTGVIGTLGVSVAGGLRPGARTTPDAAELQALLATMRDAGVEHVSMEVSSHGLELDRVWLVKFDAALFTNLTRDHLDFHTDPDSYYRAKRRLFTDYTELARPEKELVGLLNLDDPAGQRLAQEATCRVATYGLNQAAEVRATHVHSTRRGLSLLVNLPDRQEPLPLDLPLIGRFNAYNALGVVSCAWALGFPPGAIRRGLEGLTAVPGRFERVEVGQDFAVVVDYAHTPDALRNVLTAARELNPRRLLCVVGCGGDRDPGKRPQMGQLATTLADYTFFTSDNPRTEDPQAILRQIVAGAQGDAYEVIPDRREAIFTAVERCQPEELLLIAGKGHETYQEVEGQLLPFDDREVAREAIRLRTA